MYTDKQIQTITNNMEKYGGSFFKLIAQALRKADAENRDKLLSAFSEECVKYLNGWK